MWDIFERAKMYTLVVPKLAVAHVTVILDNFPNMLRRQILLQYQNPSMVPIDSLAHLLAHINKASFSLLPVPLLLHLNPFLRLMREHLGRHGTRTAA